jgi:hypothetical protein
MLKNLLSMEHPDPAPWDQNKKGWLQCSYPSVEFRALEFIPDEGAV